MTGRRLPTTLAKIELHKLHDLINKQNKRMYSVITLEKRSHWTHKEERIDSTLKRAFIKTLVKDGCLNWFYQHINTPSDEANIYELDYLDIYS